MIHITFSQFADMMLWGTVPLTGGLGFWEHHLALTDTDHMLVQIILLLVVYGWAYVWNSFGEHDRLAHFISGNENHRKIHPIEPVITERSVPTFIFGNNGRHMGEKKDVSIEFVEKNHVSYN